MPPWLDSAEEVAALTTAVVVAIGTIIASLLTVAGGLIVLWRTKIKPALAKTQTAAEHAADQLTPNHGSTARDSLGRIESVLDRLDRSMNRQIGEIRADMTRHNEWSDRQHSELFRRVNHLESPMEDTRP